MSLPQGGSREVRDQALDAIRAIAAISVVAYHLPRIGPKPPLPEWALSATGIVGASGVELFFTLSAFLLTALMPSNEAKARPLLSFYLKRFFRIAPLFYVLIIFWAGYRYLKGGPFIPDFMAIATEVTFTFNLLPKYADTQIFAAWTLGVEMLFYAAFPFLFRALSTPRLRVAALLISIPSLTLVMLALSYLPIDSKVLARYGALTIFRHLPAFMLGMVALDVHRVLERRPDRLGYAAIFAAGAVVLFWSVTKGKPILAEQTQTAAWGCALLATTLFRWPWVNRFTAFLGRISYSIYLWHGPILVTAIAGPLARLQTLGLRPSLAYALSLVLAFAIIIPVSWVSYRVIERPGIWVGDRLIERVRRPKLQRATA